MSEERDRREILKWLGSLILAVVLFPLGLAGCGGGEEMPSTAMKDSTDSSDGSESPQAEPEEKEPEFNHEVPHPDDLELAEAEANGQALGGAQRVPGGKSPKDGPSVLYQHKPNGKQYCGSCTMYVPDTNGDGFGACTLVKGKIHPCDFCILYSQHTGEGVVSCGQVG